jgi:hypothetical protein
LASGINKLLNGIYQHNTQKAVSAYLQPSWYFHAILFNFFNGLIFIQLVYLIDNYLVFAYNFQPADSEDADAQIQQDACLILP